MIEMLHIAQIADLKFRQSYTSRVSHMKAKVPLYLGCRQGCPLTTQRKKGHGIVSAYLSLQTYVASLRYLAMRKKLQRKKAFMTSSPEKVSDWTHVRLKACCSKPSKLAQYISFKVATKANTLWFLTAKHNVARKHPTPRLITSREARTEFALSGSRSPPARPTLVENILENCQCQMAKLQRKPFLKWARNPMFASLSESTLSKLSAKITCVGHLCNPAR